MVVVGCVRLIAGKPLSTIFETQQKGRSHLADDVPSRKSEHDGHGPQHMLYQALLHSFAFRIDSRVSTTSPDFEDASAATA